MLITENMTTEQLRQLQLKSLEMTLYFQRFCEENGLLFYFCGGCCIGALRHGGFIPWDDDVDVFMPRDDYEKLKVLWNEKADIGRYSCIYQDEKTTDHNIFLTIRDNQTTYIKPYQAKLDIPHGIVLDVLPLDGYPGSSFQRKKQVFWALIYSLYCSRVVPEKHGKLLRVLCKIALSVIPNGRLSWRIWRHAEKKMTKYKIRDCDSITELCAGPHYMRNRYPKEAFSKAEMKEFEGHLMPVPVGYHEYLSIAFGDYMQLPPKDKQLPHHDFTACDLEKSYIEYKGKYYCVTGKE